MAESACHAMLLGHSVEDGLHHRRGDRDACLANTVALLSQNGNDRCASVSRFAAFLLVLVQPSSQRPRREPRSEDIRQPCRQVVRDHPVVPSLQVAQQCVVQVVCPLRLRRLHCCDSLGAIRQRTPFSEERHAVAPPGWPLRLWQGFWGSTSVATQSHKALVYCSSKLGFPTRLFFGAGGHFSISSLVAALSSRERGSLPRHAVLAKLCRRMEGNT